jgi:hypothetical protein
MASHPSIVRLIGSADGVCYTPQIIADQLGFFRDEGIELDWDGRSDRAGLARAMELAGPTSCWAASGDPCRGCWPASR